MNADHRTAPITTPTATRGLARRDVLGLGLVTAGALALGRHPGGSPVAAPVRRLHAHTVGTPSPPPLRRFTQDLRIPPVLTPTTVVDGVDYYDIEQRVTTQQILPPPYPPSEIWGYNGQVPGPTIRQQRRGNRTVVRQKNALPEPFSTHLHGSPSQPSFDGHPEDLTWPGATKAYKYPNDEEGRTLWYHDHAIHQTAEHVYRGLAGFFVQQPHSDEVTMYGLDRLPADEFDIPLMVHDMQFASDGTVLFDDEGHDSLIGNVNLVNAVPWPRLRVQTRKYRFRLLVASVSRGYVFALSNGMPITVIGTDAGLLRKPVAVSRLRQGMAERYDVVIDFSGLPRGATVVLRNLADRGPMRDVMQFVVDSVVDDRTPLPERLNDIRFPSPATVSTTRRFRFERGGGQWVINGKPWDFDRIDARPRVGTTERWILENKSGGWFHPVHLHLVDFKIHRRNGRLPFRFERGWKDVVYVGENETVELLATFHAPPMIDPTVPVLGRYVMHCHNLVHEDHDMMAQFETQAGSHQVAAGQPSGSMMMLQWELQA